MTTLSRADLAAYDPFSPDVLRDPYPWYRLLRDEAPCHYVASRNLYVVSRFEDVAACAKNHGVFSSTGGVGFDWEPQPMMPMYDPPLHTRLRRLVSRPFQAGSVAELAKGIDATANRLITKLADGATIDLVDEFAVPLSLSVIADLIGLEEEKRSDLRRWSQGIVEDLAGGLDAAAAARVETLRRELITFIRALVAERRARPTEGATDVISVVLNAEENDVLTEKEVLAFCVLLLVAGYETSVNAIANGVLAVMGHPEQWAKVLADRSHFKTLADEMVRWDGAVQSFFRDTLSETSLHGVTIPKGVKVQLLFASANRDERKYPNPDAFLVDRVAHDHVGYGAGIHYCLGAPLARAQLSSTFRAFAERAPAIELDGEVVRGSSVLFRGVKKLPIRLAKGRG
jgi:cytochrome P450